MNAITGILMRELLTPEDRLNIVWTPVDNAVFENKIKNLNHKLLSFNHLYFGYESPHLIVCNNKIIYREKCKNISIQFHIPILMIDHYEKPPNITEENEEIDSYGMPCCYKVAMSEKISESWSSTKYEKIINKSEDVDWNNILYNTSKLVFKYKGYYEQ